MPKDTYYKGFSFFPLAYTNKAINPIQIVEWQIKLFILQDQPQ